MKDLVMNLLAQIRLPDFDWKGILPAAQKAVVENLNVARTLSQGLEATVSTFVGLLGVGALVLARLGVDRLPGTIHWKGENVSVTIPVLLMVIVSIVGTIVLNLLFRR